MIIPSNIKLNIKSITELNKEAKYIYAVEELSKALKVDSTLNITHKEEPIPIVSDIINQFTKEYEKITIELIRGIVSHISLKKAKDIFEFPSSVVFNPKTGKPLTQKEWNTITSAMKNYLDLKTESIPQRMASYSAAVGSLVSRLEATGKVKAENLTLKDIKNKLPKSFDFKTIKSTFKNYSNPILFRSDNIGTYITETNQKMLNGIKRIMIDGLQHQKTAREIEENLFDEYSSRNRDWARIAKTEVQNSYSDGSLASEIINTPEEEPIYMIGMGSAGACAVCQRDIIGKVVRLLPTANKGDDEYISGDPITDIAIWIGKSSIGYSAKERRSVISRHPHCGCRWVRYYPEISKVSKNKSK